MKHEHSYGGGQQELLQVSTTLFKAAASSPAHEKKD
jgi:hypothetical protein